MLITLAARESSCQWVITLADAHAVKYTSEIIVLLHRAPSPQNSPRRCTGEKGGCVRQAIRIETDICQEPYAPQGSAAPRLQLVKLHFCAVQGLCEFKHWTEQSRLAQGAGGAGEWWDLMTGHASSTAARDATGRFRSTAARGVKGHHTSTVCSALSANWSLKRNLPICSHS